MSFALLSFVAGLLTVLAPCVLPMLPIVVGSSAVSARRYTLAVVIASLGISIFAFTFLLKVSTAFIAIPTSYWSAFSGALIFFFGVTLLFPRVWGAIPFLSSISAASNRAAGSGVSQGSYTGDAILGASLGPIFSTCSPTYFVILASVLPASFMLGSLYLALYITGIALALTVVVYAGEALFARLQSVADTRGWVKKAVGVVFVVLGIGIMFGFEKKVEIAILDSGYDIAKIETYLSGPATPLKEDMVVPSVIPMQTVKNMFKEFVNPAGFVFSEPFAMSDIVGKKSILVAIFTYSCSNCQNAMPYINAINAQYAGEDFVVIGVHTPEFSYEKNIDNVRRELTEQGVTFPVVLDNDYGTWRAYDNNYWPARYLINKQGEVVFKHFGEGEYAETEAEIIKLLQN
jgi:cytochrome c biogenesis protein CcdA/thiol-disulfide isomerase/thioredoxin